MPSKLFAPSYAAAPSCSRVEQLRINSEREDLFNATLIRVRSRFGIKISE